jgi:hypothetical protein
VEINFEFIGERDPILKRIAVFIMPGSERQVEVDLKDPGEPPAIDRIPARTDFRTGPTKLGQTCSPRISTTTLLASAC